MRGDGPTNLVFSAADCAVGGSGNSAADGREPDVVMGRADGAVWVGGINHCHHAIVVFSSGFAVVGPSPDHGAGKGGAWAGGFWPDGFVLAGTAFDFGHGTTRVLGFRGLDWRIVFVGAGIGALEALAIRHGCIQRDGLAGDGCRR